MFAGLVKVTPAATRELAKLGLGAEDLALGTQSVEDVFRSLNTATQDLDLTETARVFAEVFGRRNVSAALLLANNVDALGNASNEAGKSAAELADELNNTLIGRFKELVSSVQEGILQLGDGGLGRVLKGVTESLTSLVRGITGVGTAADQLGRNITGVTRLLATLIGGLGGAVVAFGALKVASLALATVNPFFALLTGIGAAAGLLFTFRDELVQFGGESVRIGDLVAAGFGAIGDRLRFIATDLAPAVTESFLSLFRSFGDGVQAIATFTDNVLTAVFARFNSETENSQGGLRRFTNFTIGAFKAIGDVVRGGLEIIASFFGALTDVDFSSLLFGDQSISDIFAPAIAAADKSGQEMADRIKGSFDTDFVGDIAGAFGDLGESASAKFTEGVSLEAFTLDGLLSDIDSRIAERAGERAGRSFREGIQGSGIAEAISGNITLGINAASRVLGGAGFVIPVSIDADAVPAQLENLFARFAAVDAFIDGQREIRSELNKTGLSIRDQNETIRQQISALSEGRSASEQSINQIRDENELRAEAAELTEVLNEARARGADAIARELALRVESLTLTANEIESNRSLAEQLARLSELQGSRRQITDGTESLSSENSLIQERIRLLREVDGVASGNLDSLAQESQLRRQANEALAQSAQLRLAGSVVLADEIGLRAQALALSADEIARNRDLSASLDSLVQEADELSRVRDNVQGLQAELRILNDVRGATGDNVGSLVAEERARRIGNDALADQIALERQLATEIDAVLERQARIDEFSGQLAGVFGDLARDFRDDSTSLIEDLDAFALRLQDLVFEALILQPIMDQLSNSFSSIAGGTGNLFGDPTGEVAGGLGAAAGGGEEGGFGEGSTEAREEANIAAQQALLQTRQAIIPQEQAVATAFQGAFGALSTALPTFSSAANAIQAGATGLGSATPIFSQAANTFSLGATTLQGAIPGLTQAAATLLQAAQLQLAANAGGGGGASGAIGGAAGGFGGGFGGGFANGGTFGPGGVTRFANGGNIEGVISSPTLFGIDERQLGIAGERGLEAGFSDGRGNRAIAPLSRRNGRMGIEIQDGGGGQNLVQNITVVANTPEEFVNSKRQIREASRRSAGM